MVSKIRRRSFRTWPEERVEAVEGEASSNQADAGVSIYDGADHIYGETIKKSTNLGVPPREVKKDIHTEEFIMGTQPIILD